VGLEEGFNGRGTSLKGLKGQREGLAMEQGTGGYADVNLAVGRTDAGRGREKQGVTLVQVIKGPAEEYLIEGGPTGNVWK
jgi:hypothetical protein